MLLLPPRLLHVAQRARLLQVQQAQVQRLPELGICREQRRLKRLQSSLKMLYYEEVIINEKRQTFLHGNPVALAVEQRPHLRNARLGSLCVCVRCMCATLLRVCGVATHLGDVTVTLRLIIDGCRLHEERIVLTLHSEIIITIWNLTCADI